MKKQLDYKSASDELQKIVAEIEDENIGLDELNEKIKRAVELISYCQNRLREVQTDIDNSINKLHE